MRLIVKPDGLRYRLWVEEPDSGRRPVLSLGDAPSWTGGWARVDGTGLHERQDAVLALAALGLDAVTAWERACGGSSVGLGTAELGHTRQRLSSTPLWWYLDELLTPPYPPKPGRYSSSERSLRSGQRPRRDSQRPSALTNPSRSPQTLKNCCTPMHCNDEGVAALRAGAVRFGRAERFVRLRLALPPAPRRPRTGALA
jgi:hypothetical protein